ncbi:MAG: hypothetical protein EXX96DRAFT_621987 [Benjaminiella poitrasii]|nr:MAG: hypothetical protein EXX96DRAFT_621987 [Benjaminiella poitrasii]
MDRVKCLVAKVMKFMFSKWRLMMLISPLDNATTFTEYMELKPPEKPVKERKAILDKAKDESNSDLTDKLSLNTYRKYKKEDMDYHFYLINEKGIPKSIEAGDKLIQQRKAGSGRLISRLPTLTDAHSLFLTELIDDNADLTLEQMIDKLTDEFKDLKISRSSLHDFTTKKCRITFKRAYFHSVENNSSDKIEDRYQWVKIGKTRTLTMKATAYSWVKTPKVAAAASEKRKLEGSQVPETVKSKCNTVTGHYFNFIASTLDITDKYEEF